MKPHAEAKGLELEGCWWIPRLREQNEERHHGNMAAGLEGVMTEGRCASANCFRLARRRAGCSVGQDASGYRENPSFFPVGQRGWHASSDGPRCIERARPMGVDAIDDRPDGQEQRLRRAKSLAGVAGVRQGKDHGYRTNYGRRAFLAARARARGGRRTGCLANSSKTVCQILVKRNQTA